MKEEKKTKYYVSWDIASNGSNWVVQFWKQEKDGIKTLIQQLNKDSDDGGSFEFPPIP